MLEDVKSLLGITDTDRDSLLNIILKMTQARLKVLLASDTIPEALGYIVTEVTVARFNRIGSEGTASHSVAGETMSFTDDDFTKYQDDIQAYLGSASASTVVRFL